MEKDITYDLSLSTQILALIRAEFLLALNQCSPSDFVPRPKSLDKASRLKSGAVNRFRETKDAVKQEITRRKGLFRQGAFLSELEAADYAARSLLLETQLLRLGAVYGNQAYNFTVDSLRLPASQLKSIEDTALAGYYTILDCKKNYPSGNPTEAYLNNLDLAPQGARVDIILAPDGPKIIEVNCQWVDGIQALEALRTTYRGPCKPYPSEQLANFFPDRNRLAIILLNSAQGSRKQGEYKSLATMADQLVTKNLFTQVEIIDPNIVRLDYLSRFKSFYLDGDPRMIPGVVPDWLAAIYQRLRSGATAFPQWNPGLDKKDILIEASSRQPDLFAPTLPFSESVPPDFVIKGDGFSSRQVAMPGTELFSNIYQDAVLLPQDYVLQSKLTPVNLPPVWVYDTSANSPLLLTKPLSKFSLWIINGKVAGTMVSLSDQAIISDRDYNTVPIPI